MSKTTNTTIRSTKIITNLFPLKITKKLNLYIHKIIATPEIRKAIQSDFLMRILSENEITKDQNWAFDGSKIFVSEKPSNTNFEVNAGKNTYKISIEVLEEFSIDSQTKSLSESQMQALDLILRSHTIKNNKFKSCGRKQIITSESTQDRRLAPVPISDNVVIAKGIVQATRFLQLGAFLNVDNALQAFYDTKPLIEIFKFYESIRKPDGFQKLLKSVKIETMHLKKPMTFKAFGLSEPANNNFFEIETQKISVAEYFDKNYKRLNYPNFPCVQRKKGDMLLSFPLEVLRIAKNQKVLGKLQDRQISDVIKITAKRPREKFDELKQKMSIMEVTKNELLDNLGIQIGSEFTKLDAQILTPPGLLYANPDKTKKPIVKMPENGEWNLIDVAAIKPANFSHCTIIDCAGTPHRAIEDNFEKFRRTLYNFHIKIGSHSIVSARNPDRDLDQAIKGFCLVILPIGRNNKVFYKNAKCISELHRENALTQCIKQKNFMRMNASLAANIALKMCMKQGGFPNYLSQGISLFKQPTMVVGIDVSHPGMGQNVGTLAALVASLDNQCTKYATFMEFQDNRQEVLSNLNVMMVQALNKFKETVKIFPKSLIVFRDGVAASQFDNICKVEIDLIRDAFKTAKIDCKLTYIVAQKKHSVRFCTEQPHGRRNDDTNALPGTCVLDANVVGRNEFYMVSHKALLGTARPVRYTVLEDENNYGNAIPKFIYDLCHMYGRCTKSVSVVSPIYFAHLAATRAKIYRDNQETALVNNKDKLFYL